MKRIYFGQAVILVMALFVSAIVSTSVFAEESTTEMGVAYRGHVQNKGNIPQLENSYIDGPTELGTRGEGLRVEGFQFKLTGTVPEGMQIRYNVHVQNKGWLYKLDDPTTWAKNGEFAGTRGESLRIEAIEIILLDADGNASNGYSVLYRGHIQNKGNQPLSDEEWLKDGDPLGTTGSGLRLEAIQVKIVKTDSNPELEAYQALISTINGLAEKDYTPNTWSELQTVISKNSVTFEGNTVKEIKAATAAIQSAYDKLVKKEAAVVYGTSGTYGPASGTQVINGDVIVKASGVTLQNLEINGELIISDEAAAKTTEAMTTQALEDGQISTNPVINMGPTAVVSQVSVYGCVSMPPRTSIVMTSSQRTQYQLSQLQTAQIIRVTTMESSSGAPLEVSAGSDSTLTFGGMVGGLTLSSPGSQVALSPGTIVQQLTLSGPSSQIALPLGAIVQQLMLSGPDSQVALSSGAIVQQLTVLPEAPHCLVTTVPGAQIYNLSLQGDNASITGLGQIDYAQILANGAIFGSRPSAFAIGPDVTMPPIMPAPPTPEPDPTPEPEQPGDSGGDTVWG